MNLFKHRKKILVYLGIILFVLGAIVLSLELLILFSESTLTKMILKEINPKLKVNFKIEKVSISIFRNFPNVAIEGYNLSLPDPLDTTKSFMALEKISLLFNLTDIVREKITIHSIFFENGYTHIKRDTARAYNFHLLKEDALQNKPNQKVQIKVNRIRFRDIVFHFEDSHKNTEIKVKTKELWLIVNNYKESDNYTLYGNVFIFDAAFRRYNPKNNYFNNKTFRFNVKAKYDKADRKVSITTPSDIKVDNAIFELKGSLDFKDNNYLNLLFKTENANLTTALELLPPGIQKISKKYKSDGLLSARAQIRMNVLPDEKPRIDIDFNGKNLYLQNKETDYHIDDLSIEGSFTSGFPASRENSVLTINKIIGVQNNRVFEGRIRLNDLTNPFLSIQAKGEFDLGEIFGFYPVRTIEKIRGYANLDVDLGGHIKDFFDEDDSLNLKARGQVSFKDIFLKLKPLTMPFEKVSGIFTLTDKLVSTNDLIVHVGKSDFKAKAQFPHLFLFLINPDKPFRLRASFESDSVNLNEMLESGAERLDRKRYQFGIYKILDLDLIGNVKHTVFRKFSAQNLNLNIEVKEESMKINQLKMNALQGTAELSMDVRVLGQDSLELEVKSELNNIEISSFFHDFENFQQRLLKSESIRGGLDASIYMRSRMDKSLNWNVGSFFSTVDVSIMKCELKDFEPIIKILKMIYKAKDIKDVYFDEIKNTFKIEKREFIVPQMEVASNFFNFFVKGRYTLNEKIDFDVQIPFGLIKKHTIPTKVGIENVKGMSLLIKLRGEIGKVITILDFVKKKKKEKALKF